MKHIINENSIQACERATSCPFQKTFGIFLFTGCALLKNRTFTKTNQVCRFNKSTKVVEYIRLHDKYDNKIKLSAFFKLNFDYLHPYIFNSIM